MRAPARFFFVLTLTALFVSGSLAPGYCKPGKEHEGGKGKGKGNSEQSNNKPSNRKKQDKELMRLLRSEAAGSSAQGIANANTAALLTGETGESSKNALEQLLARLADALSASKGASVQPTPNKPSISKEGAKNQPPAVTGPPGEYPAF